MKVVWLLLVVVLVGAGCSAGDSPSSDVGGVSSLPVVPGDVKESLPAVPQVVESMSAEPTTDVDTDIGTDTDGDRAGG